MVPTAKLVLLLNTLLFLDSTNGAPIHRREVPQEHSHEQFLTSVSKSLQLNDPNGILDSVFGLLGNAAAAAGAGKITDLDCLHQATADQAFTNAKAAGDVQGQVDALIYAALERNTGSVGLKSNLCTSIKAVNPEIAALSQHQDPASDGAAATNKAITLALAQQIAKVGGNPQDALKAGTFAPGKIGDPTAKGNTCDDANDAVGCIFTQNLLVPDATAAEIDAAVGGSGAVASSASGSTSDASSASAAAVTDACSATATVTVTASASDATATASASATTATSDASSSSSDAVVASSGAAASSGSLDFGSCSNPAIEFGLGFDGRTEDSFQPENKNNFNHGSALNIKVITDFICQQLQSKCKASADTITKCNSAATAAIAQGANGGAADTFNAGLGITSDFAQNPVGGSLAATAASTPAAASNSTSSSSKAVSKSSKVASKSSMASSKSSAASPTAAASSGSSGALDFGSCSNPAIQFGLGFDGRKDDSFEPEDTATFTHGSALNIQVITDFICQQLDVKCKASAATLTACNNAATAAIALGPVGAAADTFNEGLGIVTDFAKNPVNA